MAIMKRSDYAQMYGPSTGDAIRLGDTSLLAEVERDHAVPGDECLHGGGKTLRDGLGLTPGYDSAMGSLDMLPGYQPDETRGTRELNAMGSVYAYQNGLFEPGKDIGDPLLIGADCGDVDIGGAFDLGPGERDQAA